MLRTLALALLLVALPAAAEPPRLTLLISVDALGSDTLLRVRPRLRAGLRRLLDQGAFYPDARYAYAKPRTAAGHSTLATGANPWRHGIVDNRLVDRATLKHLRPFQDPQHPELGSAAGAEEDTSPVTLQAETLADRLRVATQGRGKALAFSIKGRAAIPFAGRLGQAYWFDDSAGRLTTSTWYAKELPAWVQAFNARGLPQAAARQEWVPLRPRGDYLGEDDQPREGGSCLDTTFPHKLDCGEGAPGPKSYAVFPASPQSLEFLIQAAQAGMQAEALGRDEVPDLLALSISTTDYVFHGFGPYSWEMQDMLYRLDVALGELLAAAEQAAGGRNRLLVVLSADHGGAAVPEHWAAQGLEAKRVDPVALSRELTEALQARFGQQVQAVVEELDVYLGGEALKSGQVDGAAVRRAAAEWLARHPAVVLAVARDDLQTAPDVGGFVSALRLGYYPERSGDVLFVPRPFHVLNASSRGTNHGVPYAYDQQVPVVLYGKGVRAGTYLRRISTTDVAPTISALWEVGAPASNEGEPRYEALGAGR